MRSRRFDKYMVALTVVLLAEAALFYGTSGRERVPTLQPLSEFPTDLSRWELVQDVPIEPEIQQVLRADETLNRVYGQEGSGARASLFVAYFKSQRAGQIPHSPKNCLPGSGWEPMSSRFIQVQVPGEHEPIRINRYVVARGNETSVVLYWYQSRNRIIASDFAAKFWLVADSIRYRRSDTALVRVVVPVVDSNLRGATATGADFVRSFLPTLRHYLPA
jgi:EpsI family protein